MRSYGRCCYRDLSRRKKEERSRRLELEKRMRGMDLRR
jgi:hypothetical protein